MIIDEILNNANSAAIFGHVRPDGDCVGSTLALYNYIRENTPNIKVDIFLEPFPASYRLLKGVDSIQNVYKNNEATPPYDVAFLLDTPTFERVGANGTECIKNARKSVNIDHHASNPLNLCDVNIVESGASSASELLFTQLDKSKISKDSANCIYLGIVHDTGAFKFSCTGKRTMQIVGDLIDKGIDFAKIINDTYYTRTFTQTLVTGFIMQNCKLALDGKLVYSIIDEETMNKFGATPIDLSNVIDVIREVEGTEVAVFLYPVNGYYKMSLRSNYVVDVNAIAKVFGGGGHIRAAGGNASMPPEHTIDKIIRLVDEQLSKLS